VEFHQKSFKKVFDEIEKKLLVLQDYQKNRYCVYDIQKKL